MRLPHQTAFPSAEGQTHGLTKRELMAVLLTQGLLSGILGPESTPDDRTLAELAAFGVKAADALIVALRESPCSPPLPPCSPDDDGV